ncbi:MAG: hypothetical protein KC493_05180 [Bacteriovoracaceae bacterium]|nr:hypothetical protein [Bacteriovoracaceae bacterium]
MKAYSAGKTYKVMSKAENNKNMNFTATSFLSDSLGKKIVDKEETSK